MTRIVPVHTTNTINDDLIDRLRARNARNEISAETFRLFLDNPEVVWAAADPLELVWRAVAAASYQDRAEILSDLAWVTKDPKALVDALDNRDRAIRTDPATQDRMQMMLSSTFLAYGQVPEAVEAAEAIRDYGTRVIAWCRICEQAREPEHVVRLREMRETAPPQAQMRVANHVALLSRDLSDLEYAEQLWETSARAVKPQIAGWWRCTHAALRVELGDVERGRRMAASIESLDPRIKARAKIAQHTKDEQDIQALLREFVENDVRSFKTLRSIAVACLALGKVEQMRLLAAGRSDACERCMLFSLISMAEGATKADLRNAEMAHRSMLKRTGNDSGARQQLVHALNHMGRHRDARLAAMRISAPRLRAYTYLTIHRSEVGGEPLPYETEGW